MNEPLRILIVRVGAMGDVLHALPAVAGLRAAMPGAVIGWAIDTKWRGLLSADGSAGPLVDQVHAVDTRLWKSSPLSTATMSNVLRLRRELRAARYDVCVDVQGTVRSGVIGWMAAARRYVGSAAPREGVAATFYGERFTLKERHVIGQACELVGAAAGVPIAAGRVRLPVDPGAEQWAERLVARSGKIALLSPTAGWGAKEWGAERFASLARGLRENGVRVLVNGVSGATAGVADEVAERAGAEVVRTSLPELIALTRRAALAVGGDTGPVHLAAALGRPVVALFGPTDPARNGPYFGGAVTTARVRVLRDPASVTDHRRHAETEGGLARITVEEVLQATMELLAEEKGATG